MKIDIQRQTSKVFSESEEKLKGGEGGGLLTSWLSGADSVVMA